MSVFAVSAVAAGLALAALASAFAWLAARGEFKRRTMSQAEAAHRAARGGFLEPRVGARFLGPSRGVEVTAQIGNDALRRLVAERRWREVAPWLLLAGGVVLAFVAWPFFVVQLMGGPAWLAGVVASIALVVAYRTLAPTYLA